jgi:hypothetical protein
VSEPSCGGECQELGHGSVMFSPCRVLAKRAIATRSSPSNRDESLPLLYIHIEQADGSSTSGEEEVALPFQAHRATGHADALVSSDAVFLQMSRMPPSTPAVSQGSAAGQRGEMK